MSIRSLLNMLNRLKSDNAPVKRKKPKKQRGYLGLAGKQAHAENAAITPPLSSREARLLISHVLGHESVAITSYYLSSLNAGALHEHSQPVEHAEPPRERQHAEKAQKTQETAPYRGKETGIGQEHQA